MAGKITISTLNNDTGVLATQNGMTGIAKAWVNFNGGNGNTAGTINGSFNVSSITVNGTGDYTINFTTAMSNANYSCVLTCDSVNNTFFRNQCLTYTVGTTSAQRMIIYNAGTSALTNSAYVYASFFGS
jgi:hypothetical protein